MLFQSEFSLSLKAATELLLSCSYLYGRGDDVKNNLDKILNRSIDSFSSEQAQSTLDLLVKVETIEGVDRNQKENFIRQVETIFQSQFRTTGKWG